jgi:S-DNA-T family DNA segregation ATPase FtsK/SpoIIIE
MERCDECGFEYDELPEGQVPKALQTLPSRYGTVLAIDPAVLRARPEPDVWSALECACHFRDVLQVQLERVGRALAEDEPTFEPMGRDERVVRDRYNEQDPTEVEQQLTMAARALADRFATLSPEQLARTAIYNYPAPARRTIAWIGRHTVHEGHHHLRDMEHAVDVVTSRH